MSIEKLPLVRSMIIIIRLFFGRRGKDSIPALLMPGESVIKTKGTEKYKEELTAANNLDLESVINHKYVLPAIKKIRGEQAFMERWAAENAFDDTMLLKQMKKPVSIKNVDELSSAIFGLCHSFL